MTTAERLRRISRLRNTISKSLKAVQRRLTVQWPKSTKGEDTYTVSDKHFRAFLHSICLICEGVKKADSQNKLLYTHNQGAEVRAYKMS